MYGERERENKKKILQFGSNWKRDIKNGVKMKCSKIVRICSDGVLIAIRKSGV